MRAVALPVPGFVPASGFYEAGGSARGVSLAPVGAPPRAGVEVSLPSPGTRSCPSDGPCPERPVLERLGEFVLGCVSRGRSAGGTGKQPTS